LIGIYALVNRENGKRYIGQSRDIEDRWKQHFRELRQGKHYNVHLQRSFDLYSESAFETLVLEECNLVDLPLREQAWVDEFPRDMLYNQIFDVQYRQGESNPFFGKRHTEDFKKRMSDLKKIECLGEKNPNFGRKHNATTRLSMITHKTTTKLTVDDVKKIADLLRDGQLSHSEIANRFAVQRTVVTRISLGTRWVLVTGGPINPVVVNENGKRVFSEIHKARIGAKRKGKRHTEITKKVMSEKALQRHAK
jgi:group I intron endonuclease